MEENKGSSSLSKINMKEFDEMNQNMRDTIASFKKHMNFLEPENSQKFEIVNQETKNEYIKNLKKKIEEIVNSEHNKFSASKTIHKNGRTGDADQDEEKVGSKAKDKRPVKKFMCKIYLMSKGFCKKGDQCPFGHSLKELKEEYRPKSKKNTGKLTEWLGFGE